MYIETNTEFILLCKSGEVKEQNTGDRREGNARAVTHALRRVDVLLVQDQQPSHTRRRKLPSDTL